MSAREELLALARRHMWAAWQLSSEELASQAAATLLGLGMLVPEGGAAELEKLRVRVAELESERHSTNESLSEAAEQLRVDRDRIAELEAELRIGAPWTCPTCSKENRRDVCVICETDRPDAKEDCDHPNGYGPHGCAGCGASTPADDEDDVTPQVTKLRALLAGQRQQTGGAS